MNDGISTVAGMQPQLPPFGLKHLGGLVAGLGAAGFATWLLRDPTLFAVVSAITQSPSIQTVGLAIGSLQTGVLLFVGVAALAWKCNHMRLEPGHYLAIQATAIWTGTLITNCVSKFVLEGLPGTGWIRRWLMIGNLVVVIGFVCWYLWLAIRGNETKAWRRAFLTLAVVPIVGMLFQFANMWDEAGLGPPRSFGLYLLTQSVVRLSQAVGLIAAMASDYRRGVSRHWSHWLAVVLCVLGFVSSACFNAWLSRNVKW